MMLEDEALECYRKLVSLIYREVGAMRRENHPELYDRSKISYVHLRRKEEPRIFYLRSKSENDVKRIEIPYANWSGLTLEECAHAFQDGDWLLDRKRHSFGGPKWAKVTETALALRQAISNEDWQQIPQLVEEVKSLHHNNGLIVEKFKELGP